MKRLTVAILALLLFAAPAAARIQDTLIGEDTNFTLMNGYYLRQGLDRFEIGGDRVTDQTQIPFRVAYGLMHNFEMGADIPYLIYSGTESGLGDIRIYQKYKFTEEEYERPALAGGLALHLPTGDEDKGTGTGKVGFEVYGVAMRTLGQYTANLHLGYRFQGNSNYDNIFNYNLALKSPIPQIARNFSGVLELNGQKGDLSEAYLVPGILWNPKDDFHLGLGVRIGLTKDSYDYGVLLRIGHDF